MIGVEDNESNEIIGIENISNPDDQRNFLREISEIVISYVKPKPYYHINFIEDEDKIIAIINIYTARNICYINGKVPIRSGESSYYLSDQADIDNLIAS
ncbi:RNA-binding domain-containing protein [Herpetosiphon giganteus]|uniref:RNA-binding domain-containing protein n=1 Tax=Herpetosiphon giganteus TaxID=2029754 RepID=UPI003B837614